MAPDGEGIRWRQDSDDKGKQRTRLSWKEAVRDSMACSAAAAPMTASMQDWKLTDSTGRHQRVIRRVDGSTILVEAPKLSIAKWW